MKAIYSDIEMILTFGGAIFLFLWIRFVEKDQFHPLGFGEISG